MQVMNGCRLRGLALSVLNEKEALWMAQRNANAYLAVIWAII